MGDATRPSGLDAAQLEAFRRKLEEFEAMGLDTAPLRRVLERAPQEFEREADAFLRRELTGEGAPPPEDYPEEPAPAEPDAGVPEIEPPEVIVDEAPPVAEPEPEPAQELPPEFPPPVEPAPPAEPLPAEIPEPPSDPLPADPGPDEPIDLPVIVEPEVAVSTEVPPEPEPEAPIVEPGPAEPPASRDAIEEAMLDELEQAMAEEDLSVYAGPPARTAPRAPRSPSSGGPPPPPPPLASGDSLGGSSAVSAAPAVAAAGGGARKPPPPSSGKKPPPPGAVRAGSPPGAPQPMRPVKVAAAPQPKPPPHGAKPAAAAGPGATEVLPAERKTRSRAAPAAALVLVLLASYALYTITANAAPVAVLGVASGPFEAGQLIGFSANQSSDPNGDSLRFAWDFGDSATAIGAYVEHAYARSGNYSVVLTATDREGLLGSAQVTVRVTPGSVTPPPYRYGDRLDATVSGTSNVEASGDNPEPLGTFTAALPPVETLPRTYAIWGINLSYTGTQFREIATRATAVPDGFLALHDTYESKRFLDLSLSGIVDNDSPWPEITYTGDSQVTQSDFTTLLANDTVRRLSTQHTTVEIEDTDPPTTMESSAQLIEYPDLATAAEQLRMESIYAGRSFSTEQPQSGGLRAEGFDWTWKTEGTHLIAGQLTVALNFTLADRVPGTLFIYLYVKLWLSSASSFPLQEEYYVRAIEPGRTYNSFFRSVATGTGTPGTSAIPYGNTGDVYPGPPPTAFGPLGRVPSGGAAPDFAFSATEAYGDAQNQPDFTSFLASNPDAYAVNGSYGLNAGNPRWLIDFDQNLTGETMRIDVERGGTFINRTVPGQAEAELSAADIGNVVSLDFATAVLEDEEQAISLFPGGVLSALHANFTVRSALSVPSLSFNAASAATRQAIPYAFGVESRPEEATRIRAYVDATTGQIAFSVSETGDSLP